MATQVRVTFVAEGAQAIANAFKSVKQQAQELAKVQKQSTTATKEAAAAAQSMKPRGVGAQALKAENRERLAGLKAEVQANQQALREFARTEREKTRIALREAQARARAENGIAGSGGRSKGGWSPVNAISKAGRGTMGTVRTMVGGAAIGAGAMTISAVTDAIALEKRAALLQNATTMGGFLIPGMGTKDLMGKAQSLGRYGIKAEDVMGGMETVAAKGGGAVGLKAYVGDMEDLAKTAQAAGVSMADMGAVYAAAMQAGVKPGDEIRTLMRDMIEVGKTGSVEFKDLATEMPRLLGAGLSTELKGGAMARRQVGLAQLAVRQQVTPEESRTSVRDLVRDLTTHAGKLEKAGVKVFNDKGLMRDPAAIVADTIMKANSEGIAGSKGIKGLMGGKGGAIFSGTSTAIVTELNKIYQESHGDKRAAMMRAVNEAGGSTMSASQRDQQFANVAATNEAKWTAAIEQFKAKMTEVLPEISALIPAVTQATSAFANVATWAAKNPFTGLGALFGAHLVKEVAAAQIASTLQSGLKNGFSAMGPISVAAMTATIGMIKLIDEGEKTGAARGKSQEELFHRGENIASEMGNINDQLKDPEITDDRKIELSEAFTKLALEGAEVDKGLAEIARPKGTSEKIAGFLKTAVKAGYDPREGGTVGAIVGSAAEHSAAGIAGNVSEVNELRARLGEATNSLSSFIAKMNEFEPPRMSDPNNGTRN